MNTRRLHLTALLTMALTALHAPAHGQIIQQWITQWGTTNTDVGNGVAVDGAGRTWVAGYTNGDVGGTSAGSADLFLMPLSPTGVLGTSVQRGGTFTDVGVATAVVGGSTVFGVAIRTRRAGMGRRCSGTTTRWPCASAPRGSGRARRALAPPLRTKP